MKSTRFLLIIILSVCLLPNLLFAQAKTITILHTNDLHSYVLGYAPNLDYNPKVTGADATRGGYARLATLLKREREKRTGPVFTLDGGDFLMGTLFHLPSREKAMELKLMKAMGYDAVVLGNHEFDLKPRGLAQIIAAAAAEDALPVLLLANALFSPESDKDDSLEAQFTQGRVKPYVVMERGGIRVGIFGIMGRDAAEKAPFAAPMKFADPIETATRLVRELRDKERVDLVVCLSHSGVKQKVKGDEYLAEKVPGIDVIVGGHSHTKLDLPLKVNSTLIVQAGEHGKYLGALELVLDRGKVTLKDYKLHPVDATIRGDEAILAQVERFIAEIDRLVLKERGLSFYKTIAETGFDITIKEEESPLGNLVADASRWYANKYAYDPQDPTTKVVIAVDSNGLIRENLVAGKTGKLTVADIFRVLPMGIGMDDTLGYPLISCYLYGAEIKKALEVLTSVYPLKGSSYFLQVSGLKFTYNPHRMLFDRVTGIFLGSEEEGWQPLDYSEKNKQLYRVVANIYNATFLKIIGSFTYNILTIVPKDRQGRPISDLAEYRIDADKTQPGIQEVKQWLGLIEYLAHFRDLNGNGIPDVPEKYRGKLGRIVAQASYNPVALFSGGTWVTWAAVGVLVFVLLLLVGFFYLFRWLIRRRRKRPSIKLS